MAGAFLCSLLIITHLLISVFKLKRKNPTLHFLCLLLALSIVLKYIVGAWEMLNVFMHIKDLSGISFVLFYVVKRAIFYFCFMLTVYF